MPDIYKTNRNCEIRKETEYICVHDTANASPKANAEMHDRWIHSMAVDSNNTNTVSWHFVVGEDEIYQNLPLDEVAHHAGDGIKNRLNYTISGVKADKEETIFSISNDGYYEINGKKTIVKCPLDSQGNIPTNDKLPNDGIGYIIDSDRNYLIGNTWWSDTYQRIGNYGGNLSSIGIETCVNLGCNYTTIMRNTAKLVAELLIKYKLPLNRVKQHNYFSGKDCPMTMRRSNRWDEFLKLVEIEKYYQENFSEAKLKFESLDLDYLDNCGNIIKYEAGKKVRYKVSLLSENDKYEQIFESVMDNCGY